MGLTRERVMQFVERNVLKERVEFVKQTLEKNPILMSVSAITFYCAALCQVLGNVTEDTDDLKLSTYTQITAYIMQVNVFNVFNISSCVQCKLTLLAGPTGPDTLVDTLFSVALIGYLY